MPFNPYSTPLSFTEAEIAQAEAIRDRWGFPRQQRTQLREAPRRCSLWEWLDRPGEITGSDIPAG
jgi:hypothetical protein